MNKFIVATIHPWNISNARKLKERMNNIKIITKKEQLSVEYVKRIDPKYIFFPHWSWHIPEEIYKNYKCIIFHMTDLPFGRGGTPLQNLIVRGKTKTKISALRAVNEMDAGPIYLKRPLSLEGSAQEIYQRMAKVIFEEMIPYILRENPLPRAQRGRVVHFARRKPEESDLLKTDSIKNVYDYIRMLDATGYPKAFVKSGRLKIEFSDAVWKQGIITAKAQIKWQ